MRPKNKFISSSLLVAGGCSCVATMSCNAKEEIVLKNNSFNSTKNGNASRLVRNNLLTKKVTIFLNI